MPAYPTYFWATPHILLALHNHHPHTISKRTHPTSLTENAVSTASLSSATLELTISGESGPAKMPELHMHVACNLGHV